MSLCSAYHFRSCGSASFRFEYADATVELLRRGSHEASLSTANSKKAWLSSRPANLATSEATFSGSWKSFVDSTTWSCGRLSVYARGVGVVQRKAAQFFYVKKRTAVYYLLRRGRLHNFCTRAYEPGYVNVGGTTPKKKGLFVNQRPLFVFFSEARGGKRCSSILQGYLKIHRSTVKQVMHSGPTDHTGCAG